MRALLSALLLLTMAFTYAACGGGDKSPETGGTAATGGTESTVALPVDHVDVGPIDATLAATGQKIFEVRCTTCHKTGERYIGPALGDVAKRRAPEYIMNMILAPEKMLQANADAKALLAEYGVPMTNQNLTQDEARAVLEYLRQVAETAP